MARVNVPFAVQDEAGNALSGSLFVYARDTTTQVSAYLAETGGSPVAQPISFTNGRPNIWVDAGSYDLAITTGSGSQTRPWEAVVSGSGSSGSFAAAIFDSSTAGSSKYAIHDVSVTTDRWMPLKITGVSDSGDSADGWTLAHWRNVSVNTALIPASAGAYVAGARGTFRPVIVGDAGPYDFTIYAGIAVLGSSAGVYQFETATAITYRLTAISTSTTGGGVANLTEFGTSLLAPQVVAGNGSEVGFAAWFSIASTTYGGSISNVEIDLSGGSGPGSWGGMNLWAAKVG